MKPLVDIAHQPTDKVYFMYDNKPCTGSVLKVDIHQTIRHKEWGDVSHPTVTYTLYGNDLDGQVDFGAHELYPTYEAMMTALKPR